MNTELPVNNILYKEQSYWDERFEAEDTYEWFAGFEKFKSLVDSALSSKDSRAQVLMLGCGNSTLTADMFQHGYRHITNVDYSSVVIAKMREKYKSLDTVKWEVMDITDMSFEDETFDVVIEKGTLDSLLVGEKDVWRMSDEGRSTMDAALTHVSRILKPDGIFISITFCQPHFRKPLYAKDTYGWSIECQTIGETFHFFFYVMRKGQKLSTADIALSLEYEERLRRSNAGDVHFLTDSEDEDFLLKSCELNKEV